MSAARYYSSLVGRWGGRFVFRVTREEVLGQRRFGVRAVGRLTQLLGPLTFRTALDGAGRSYHHTTLVSAAGVTVFSTDETIELSDDDRSVRMRGVQRRRLGRTVSYDASGEVDDTATRATYLIDWLGEPLVQRLQVVSSGLALTQETAWSRGEVLLRRE